MRMRLYGEREGEYVDVEILASGGVTFTPRSLNQLRVDPSTSVTIPKREWDQLREFLKL